MDIEGWEIAALEGARSHLGRARFIVELHPDAWQWSGHTRADLEGVLDSGGLEARPLSGQRDPLGEHGQVVLEGRASFGRQPLVLKATREGEKGRIRDLGGDHALAVGASPHRSESVR